MGRRRDPGRRRDIGRDAPPPAGSIHWRAPRSDDGGEAMTVNEQLMGLGSWGITLREETPREVLDRLLYFGHVAIIPGKVNPAGYGDNLLTMAKYVGVLTKREFDDAKRVGGQGMALWLGDSDDKGEVFESPVNINGLTFANTITTLMSGSTAVIVGILYSVAGTYSGTHVWQSRGKAVDYVCSTMGAEWRVNGNATLDAGPIANLFKTTPDCVIVRKDAGKDLTLTGLSGDMQLSRDVEDFSTRVVLLAEGEGEATATASANILSNPYLDIRGNPIKRTRLVSESGTSTGNAQARAQLQLNRFTGTRNALSLRAQDIEIDGSFEVGDYVWVWDPDAGLYDTSNEVTFRGQRINPIKLRAVEASWPVTQEMTVAYRHQDGTWIDLTSFFVPESGGTSIRVGELGRSLTNAGTEPVGPRPIPDTTIPGVVSWDLPFTTGVYLDGLGNTRARILVNWLLPTNADGSTILDGSHYEIRYGVSPASDWQVEFAPWGELQQQILDLSPGVDYDFQIRAVDLAGNQGAWSATETATANPDTIAPSTPAPPVVAGSRLAIQIVHTLGKASGGTYNLELDLDHLEVHVGAASGFTPDSTTLKGKVSAHAGMIAAQIPAIGTVEVEETTTRYVKVIAVDQAGNRSSPSTAATATALLIDSAHISDLTASKITAGTLSADIIVGARIKTADTGQRVELNTSGLQAYNNAGTLLASLQTNGVFFLRSATSGARLDFSNVSGIQLYDAGGTRTVWLDLDGSFELRSAASGARTVLDGTGFRAFNSGGVETVSILSTGAFTIRSASSGARIELDGSGLRAYDSGSNQTVSIDSSGTVAIVGDFKSGTTTGPRVEIDRRLTGTQAPRIRLITPSGQTTQIQSSDASGGPLVDISNFDGCGLGLWRGGTVLQNLNGTLNLIGSPVQINGTTKTFVIDHPLHRDRWLVHATTESPHNGVEYWGTVTLDEFGVAWVELPDYFEALTSAEGRAVLLTAIDNALTPPAASYPSGGRFEVRGDPGRRVSWLVKAIRKDVPPLLVEPRREDAVLRGDGPYRYLTPKEPAHD
ncbi:hypothetical protein [Nonomuraea sp. GTA35]|uniref:hypothetical protein n=1 Tax=Nonomuraea sp. GTA35 TaxID=1676746 RepID=UPI0035C0A902